MYKEIELHQYLRFTCPECGGNALTLTDIMVYNPCDTIIDISTDPVSAGVIDNSHGGRPLVTLTMDCEHCSPDLGGIHLHMAFEADSRTHFYWDTDSPEERTVG